MEAAGHAFHGARQQRRVAHIPHQQLGAGGKVLPLARGEIVQNPDALPRVGKGGAEMRTDEAATAGDEPKRHAGPPRPASTWPNSSAWPRVVSSQLKRSA